MTRLLVHLPLYTLGLALWFSALAAGGIHIPVLVTFAALIGATGFFSRFFADLHEQAPNRWQAEGLTAIAGALAIYCLLQALPLPMHWLEALAPRNADIWARSLKPFALPPPEFASVSLAPGRSLAEALKFATYAVVFAVSAQMSGRYGFHRIALLVFGSALAVATVTAAHQLTGARRLFGLYAPLEAYDIAPLLNPNNRAGYLNLGFFCGCGLLFRAEIRPYLGLIAVGLCFIAAEVLLCRSLGGTSSLAIGFVIVALMALPRALRRRAHGGDLGQLARGAVVVMIGAGAVVLARTGQGNSTLGLDARSWQKVDLWRRAAKLASDYFAWGVGRGAFASVFTGYQQAGKNLVFEHAENFPIQWAAEWGVPATVIALLALGWCLRPLVSRSTLKSTTRRCAVVGTGVLLLQNLADLALEVPAVMALLCCVLGALVGSDQKSRRGNSSNTALAGKSLLFASSGLTVICLGLVLCFGTDTPARLRHDLFEELSAHRGPPPTSFWESLRRAVRSYPAEPYFPLLGSSAALASGTNPLPWISRALERSPASPTAHLQLARILQMRGATTQALGALRQAIELDAALATMVLTLAQEWKLDLAAFEEAAPLGRAGIPLLMLLADHTSNVQLRLHLLEAALGRDPDAADVHDRMARELLQDVARKDGGLLCAAPRDECLAEIAKHIQHSAIPGDSRQIVLESLLLAERGRGTEAEDHLAQGCSQYPGDVKCLGAWVARALKNNSSGLQVAVNSLVAAGCIDAEGCASTHLGIGTLFANAGRWHSALTHFEHAAQEASSTETWQAVARAADQVGDNMMAADARRRLALLTQGMSIQKSDEQDGAPMRVYPPPDQPAPPSMLSR